MAHLQRTLYDRLQIELILSTSFRCLRDNIYIITLCSTSMVLLICLNLAYAAAIKAKAKSLLCAYEQFLFTPEYIVVAAAAAAAGCNIENVLCVCDAKHEDACKLTAFVSKLTAFSSIISDFINGSSSRMAARVWPSLCVAGKS